MLRILHPDRAAGTLCDGIRRRDFLRIGSLAFGGLTLRELLVAEARAGMTNSHKAVIMIYLVGGPPHQDLWDLKPNAPSEIAGPMRPTATNVPGIEICDLLPQLAQRTDRFTLIRSIADSQADHDAYQCFTGRSGKGGAGGGWPQFGSVVARVQGPIERSVPPFASVCYTCTHPPYNEPGPGFLGVGHSPFQSRGPTREDMILRGVTSARLGDRRTLLTSVDRIRRDIDQTNRLHGMDSITAQALDILTSSRLADALDLSKEDPKLVARYGTGDEKVHIDENGAPRVPQSFLLARRLVEAGCRVVTVNYSKWDWHGGPYYKPIFEREREDFPIFDNALATLLDDLRDRGLDRDVSVVVWGEFGRTPVISKIVGRDHWPRVNSALLAGGGMRTGQVIGATDRLGGEPVERPVKFGEVFATLYHNLGIDTSAVTLTDLNGRPQYLVEDQCRPLPELV